MDLPRRVLGILCVFSLVCALGGAVAHGEASSGDPVQKVTSLNKKALDQYSQGEFEAARALLKEALELCNTAGLEKHPIKARTQIHLGIVAIVGFKQKSLGIRFFRKALEIQPEIKLTKSLASPELQDAFEEAQATPGEGGPPETASAPAGGGDDGQAGGAPAQRGMVQASADEESAPRVRRAPAKKKKPADEEGESEGEEEEEEEGGGYKIYISFAIGSGAGIASGNGELNPMHSLKAAGFAPAQLGHITPEVGYFLKPNLLLSARVRLQYVSGLTPERVTDNSCGSDMLCSPGTGGVAAFARGTYFIGEPGKLRFLVGGELGGGNIRHAQTFPTDTNCVNGTSTSSCVDSLKGGPFLFGPVVGLLYDFGHTAGLLATLVTDVGVPNFTVNFDLNLGVALHF